MRGNALFEPGRNCATVALTQRHAVVIDAADYFRAARDAMLRAEEQILLICWALDPRIKLDPDADDGDHPNRLGDFILSLARRRRSEARRVWKEWGSKGRFRWAPVD